MRYAKIDECEVSNGEGIGVSLFVQGCYFHCNNCFNKDTWNFNGGKEWTPEVKEKFLELIDKPYIKRISILGGEPLASENLDGLLDLVSEIHIRYNKPQDMVLDNNKNHNILNENDNKINVLLPEKTIWLYTGYTVVTIMPYKIFALHPNIMSTNPSLIMSDNPSLSKEKELAFEIERKRSEIISKCDVLVDGRYEEDKRDITLKWRGSSNHRVIDIKKSLHQKKVVLWCD